MKFSTTPVRFGTIGDIALELRKALTAIAAGWNVEHNPDGTHKESVTGVRLHAPTHSTGGTDPVTVTNLAGYPGGSTTFLRADHTFAAPTGVTPAAHHTTHEPGGSDVLANAAWTTLSNTFTLKQEVQNALLLRNPAGAVNQRLWGLSSEAPNLSIAPLVDSGSGTRAGEVQVYADLSTGGFLKANTVIYERGRTTPMGEWIDVPFSAANFAGSGGSVWTVTSASSHYTLIGKTLHWTMIGATGAMSGAATSGLLLTIPGGFTAARTTDGVTMIHLSDGSGGPLAQAYAHTTGAGGTQVSAVKPAGALIGTVTLYFSICFEIA